jgi:Kef-type K+ transport system membrane component KefB
MPQVTNSIFDFFLIGLVVFLAPVLVYLSHLKTLPSVVLEIAGGIIIGPQVLHWVQPDSLLQIFSQLGLAYLLFMAGMEIDLKSMRGQHIRSAGSSYLLSLGLALLVGLSLQVLGQKVSPLLIAIILASTSLGVVMPILKDMNIVSTEFGKLVIAGATVGEFGPIVLLSLFFSSSSPQPVAQAILLVCFVMLVLLFSLVIFRIRRLRWLNDMMLRLQDTSAQLSVRSVIATVAGFVLLANVFGTETILGSFLAGVMLRFVASDAGRKELAPAFYMKLHAIGFGFLIPIFYVITGVNFDLQALANISIIVLMLVFLAALLLVRGVPAIGYRRLLDKQHVLVAGFLQATSLPFIVAATQIGVQLKLISTAISAALVAAGLLSVIIYPTVALTILRHVSHGRGEAQLPPVSEEPV